MTGSEVHCNLEYTICQATLGESEINAAVSATSLFFNADWDFQKTYIMVAGIAGISEPPCT